MSLWRREAIERFPELCREIANAENITMVWFELWYHLFEPAYQKDPSDTAMIARIYGYADWSLGHRSSDVLTSAIVSFYEHLPNHNQMRRDMPRWISQETCDMLWFAWEYTTKQKFADFRREFIANKLRIDNEPKTKRAKSASG
jgi:hypothetical protein